jgi:hypothetical protein
MRSQGALENPRLRRKRRRMTTKLERTEVEMKNAMSLTETRSRAFASRALASPLFIPVARFCPRYFVGLLYTTGAREIAEEMG